jgi:uridine phosphorylase
VKLKQSELILNPDGSIYHLHLLPEDIADTIFFVGDPDRVERVSRHFDSIEVKKQKREFITHTGRIGNKRLTVISTGIGTDNIDIVVNELDALANIDFKSRMINENKKQLTFIRIGTSGGIHKSVDIDSFVASVYGVGMDGLGVFYPPQNSNQVHALIDRFDSEVSRRHSLSRAYAAKGDNSLLENGFQDFHKGITLTATGFYGPQGRSIRLKNKMEGAFKDIETFQFDNLFCTNLEMETAAIYLLADLLGHKALSCNVILANRIKGTFSTHPKESINRLIEAVLSRL